MMVPGTNEQFYKKVGLITVRLLVAVDGVSKYVHNNIFKTQHTHKTSHTKYMISPTGS